MLQSTSAIAITNTMQPPATQTGNSQLRDKISNNLGECRYLHTTAGTSKYGRTIK